MIAYFKRILNINSKKYWDKKYREQEKRGIVRSDGKSLDRFHNYYERAESILDFGAGRGGNISYLASRYTNKKFQLVDHSRTSLRQCEEKLKDSSSLNSYEFFDSLDDFADRSIDMIMAIEVLEHIDAYREVLRRLWTILAPNGALLISVPVRGWRDRHREHVNKFTIKSMFEELAAYAEIVQISPRTYSKRSNKLSTAYFLIEK